MRECEIDLVAEHGEAALVGFSSGRHISLSSVPCVGLSPVRLCFFSIPSLPIRVKAEFKVDGECRCDFRSDNCLQVLTTCEMNIEKGRVYVIM